jgi:universal stress protein E
MFKKILVILADGKGADRGLGRASQLCKASGGEMLLFSVVYEPHLEGYLGDSELYANLRQRLVDESAEKVEILAGQVRSGGCRCSKSVQWGNVLQDAVASTVVKENVDLVVYSPRGGPGMLSRADWHLISHCPAPVLVVYSDGSAPYRHVLAAVDPYHEHGKPAALDGAIVAAAKAAADLNKADLRIVHCFTPISEFVSDGYAELPVETAEKALEEARRHALDELVGQAGLDMSVAHLVAGRPGHVLVLAAEKEHADLIVMGTVSRGAVREFFIGSTAEKVLEDAHCDVLVIKPAGFEVRISV